MKWNDAIPALGILRLVPEPGCLVECRGEWSVYKLGHSERWEFFEHPPGVGILREPSGDTYNPILPRVPKGKTCWDVFAACLCPDGEIGGYTRYFHLEDILIIWSTRNNPRFNDYILPIWTPKSDIAPPPRNTAETLPAHMRDMQKLGMLLEWIEANEVKK